MAYSKLNVDIVQKSQAAPPTDVNSEIVQKLIRAIKELRGIDAKARGIRGGTVAAFFRRIGSPALVWMTADEVEHQPNEFYRVRNCIEDAKVFIYLAMN